MHEFITLTCICWINQMSRYRSSPKRILDTSGAIMLKKCQNYVPFTKKKNPSIFTKSCCFIRVWQSMASQLSFPLCYKTLITLNFMFLFCSNPYENKKLALIARPVEQDVKAIPHLKRQKVQRKLLGTAPWKTSGWWRGGRWVSMNQESQAG